MAEGPSTYVQPEERDLIVRVLGRNLRGPADQFLASGDAADLDAEPISAQEESATRIRNATEYLNFLSGNEIGGNDLIEALKKHRAEARSRLKEKGSDHAYHAALFPFDEANQRLFDSIKVLLELSEADRIKFWQCVPVWAKYSKDIDANEVENTVNTLMHYLCFLSNALMYAQLRPSKESTLEENLSFLEPVILSLKIIKPLRGIGWKSIKDLKNPNLFPKLDHEDTEEGLGPIPATAEFIGDETMLAINLISVAFRIAGLSSRNAILLSKTDRDRARAYFEEHRDGMGKKAYIWDNFLKEVFDWADANLPNEDEIAKITRAESRKIHRRAIRAAREEGEGKEELTYENHPHRAFIEMADSINPKLTNQDILRNEKAYQGVKRNLAEARKWLSEHQLDSPEILEVLRRYEADWDFSIGLSKGGNHPYAGSTTCLLFHKTVKLSEDIERIPELGLRDIGIIAALVSWGYLDIADKTEINMEEFEKFYESYEKLHTILYKINFTTEALSNEARLADFAYLLNTLMWYLKNGISIKQNKLASIAKTSIDILPPDSSSESIKIHINEEVLLYLLIESCHKLSGHPERDPYNKTDREATLAEILKKSRAKDVISSGINRARRRGFQLSIGFLQQQLPEIFAAADEMFAGKKTSRPEQAVEAAGSAVATPPVAITDGIGAPPDVAAGATPPESPAAMPSDDAGTAEDEDDFQLPGGADALLPPDYGNEPSEIATFEQLTDIVPIIVMSKNEQEGRRKRWRADALLAKSNCDDRATVVAGNFEGTARIRHATVKEIFLARRNLQAIVFPSNLKCTGTVKLEVNKRSYLLNWQLDEIGQLAFVIGGETYNEDAFSKGIPKLTNFYLETRSIILQKLEELLVRQVRELDARTWGAVLLQPEEIDSVKPVRTRDGTEIKPRLENLLGRSVSDGSGTAGPTVTVVGRKAMELLERIRQRQPILEEDANGIILYLKLEEKIEAGKRIEPLYMPCNTIQVLQAVDSGKLSMDEVFLMSSDHRVGRAGYHPYRDTKNPRLLIATQRTPHAESEAVQHAIENHFKAHLSTTVTDATAITIPKDGEAIEAIVIGTREELAANAADTIPLEEVSRWARGEIDNISQTTRDRIRAVRIVAEDGTIHSVTPEKVTNLTSFRIFRVIFNAKQRPQFTIGSYESLAQVERKLATAEPAALEAALV